MIHPASIVRVFKTNTVLLTYFVFFLTSLFVGDGKESFVEAFWALGILFLYAVWRLETKQSILALPRGVAAVWVSVLVLYAVLLGFSDSLAYSIPSVVRFIEAYLLYTLFYTISSERTLNYFIKGLVVCGVFAIILSWVFMVFPDLTDVLPLMNLLFASYGHNHIADYLLFVFPVVIANLHPSASRWSWFLMMLYVVGILLSFARGAWAILVMYLLSATFFNKTSMPVSLRRVVLIVCATFMVLSVVLSVFPAKTLLNTLAPPAWLSRQLSKSFLGEDIRVSYWKQSLLAIRERPLFGSGPGTFYLQSLRLQEKPSSFSWFSHSLLLQSFVETGLVGLVLLFCLLAAVVYEARRSVVRNFGHPEYQATPLFHGIILVLGYSLFEFNLDFLSLFLILFAALGLLGGLNKGQAKQISWRRTTTSLFIVPSIAILLFYYLSSVSAELVRTAGFKSSLYFFVAPYRIENMKQYLSDTQMRTTSFDKSKIQSLVALLYRRDPHVAYLFAEALKGYDDVGFVTRLYEEAARGDPENIEYRERYLDFLYRHNRVDLIVKELRRKPVGNLPDNKLSLHWISTFYVLGQTLIAQNNVSDALIMWEAMANISPSWSHLSVEYAGLQLFSGDRLGAEKTLHRCLQDIYARDHCGLALQWLNEGIFPEPGFLKDEILN